MAQCKARRSYMSSLWNRLYRVPVHLCSAAWPTAADAIPHFWTRSPAIPRLKFFRGFLSINRINLSDNIRPDPREGGGILFRRETKTSNINTVKQWIHSMRKCKWCNNTINIIEKPHLLKPLPSCIGRPVKRPNSSSDNIQRWTDSSSGCAKQTFQRIKFIFIWPCSALDIGSTNGFH